MHPRIDQYRHYQQQPQQQQQQQTPQRILYLTRRPEQRPEPEQERIVVIIDDATLKLFVRRVYLYAVIFILVTSMTWLLVAWTNFAFDKAVPVPYFVWILLSFLLLMIMNCVPQTRYIFPINWVMTISIVILLILAGACLVQIFPVLILFASLVVSVAIVGILYACGAMCPQKLLPGVLCTACLSCILIINMFVFLILIIFLRNPIIGLVFAISLFCLLTVMMPFHAQYIHGRLEIVPLLDVLHCALSIHIYFVLTLFAINYLYFYLTYK
ncbi:uncharacterized protein LOC117780933 [Drosophila innubila]|uniref:uncharacterized protein LOC117780933 n=1 Tax=Drosophila innubila TaxID=198719 RepID=UPI00148B3A80|nr:uncharacterized protein LOC117780933 [Drosophila innubila]